MRLTLTYERPGNLPVAAGIVLVIVGAVMWKTRGLA